MADAAAGDAGDAPELGGAVVAVTDTRRYLRASCYFHPDRLASAYCSSCGRTLCLDCALPGVEPARCPECGTGETRHAWICPRCGWVTLTRVSACGHCGSPILLVRRPGEPAYWERRFRGRDRDSRFWAFALGALGVYGVGLLAASRQALLGEPHSPAWWVFLGLMSGLCGFLAAALAARASRFDLILSERGIELRRRRGGDTVSWDEVLGLELVPRGRPAHLVIHTPGRRLTIDRSLTGWDEALGLIRQYAAVAPPVAGDGVAE